MRLRTVAGLLAAVTVIGGASLTQAMGAARAPQRGPARHSSRHQSRRPAPIQHVVVIFQENASFDHYFGTYPDAANPAGEPRFRPAPGTPQVNAIPPVLL